MDKLRKPAVAGMFYTANKEKLGMEVDAYLEKAEPVKIDDDIFAIIVPHAGYAYSGQVAASAFKAIQGMEFDLVLLMGPSHRWYFKGTSLGMYEAYETPLGNVDVDLESGQQLLSSNNIYNFIDRAHQSEHSLEVQIPFLQKTLKGGFQILTMLFGAMRDEQSDTIAETVAAFLKQTDKKILLLCSTDLSHDFPYEEAKAMDMQVVERVKNLDAEGLLSDLEQHNCEACGSFGLMAMIKIASILGKDKVLVTDVQNSGDAVNDKHSRIVGCIGYIEAIKPLAETIDEMADSAAFHDPRFPSVSIGEFDQLDIEISILSPIEEITNVEKIEVGKHGIILTSGYRRGLLLPQVATEQGWDRQTFLEHTCMKAGLPTNAWKKGTKIEIFSAEIFGEKE